MPETESRDADGGEPSLRPDALLPLNEWIELKLAAVKAHLGGSKRNLRLIKGLYCACIFVLTYAAFWPGLQQATRSYIETGGFSWAFILAVPYFFERYSTTLKEEEIAVLTARKALLNRPASECVAGIGSITYFDRLVDINLSNLADYYFLIKTQANNGFSASLLAGALGFSLIVSGLAYGLFDKASSQVVTYVTAASGVITEFIALGFFYIYNRTVRQLKGYHDNLLTVQNILLAFKIVNETRDDGERSAMMKQMFGSLLDKTTALDMPETGGKTTE